MYRESTNHTGHTDHTDHTDGADEARRIVTQAARDLPENLLPLVEKAVAEVQFALEHGQRGEFHPVQAEPVLMQDASGTPTGLVQLPQRLNPGTPTLLFRNLDDLPTAVAEILGTDYISTVSRTTIVRALRESNAPYLVGTNGEETRRRLDSVHLAAVAVARLATRPKAQSGGVTALSGSNLRTPPAVSRNLGGLVSDITVAKKLGKKGGISGRNASGASALMVDDQEALVALEELTSISIFLPISGIHLDEETGEKWASVPTIAKYLHTTHQFKAGRPMIRGAIKRCGLVAKKARAYEAKSPRHLGRPVDIYNLTKVEADLLSRINCPNRVGRGGNCTSEGQSLWMIKHYLRAFPPVHPVSETTVRGYCSQYFEPTPGIDIAGRPTDLFTAEQLTQVMRKLAANPSTRGRRT